MLRSPTNGPSPPERPRSILPPRLPTAIAGAGLRTRGGTSGGSPPQARRPELGRRVRPRPEGPVARGAKRGLRSPRVRRPCAAVGAYAPRRARGIQGLVARYGTLAARPRPTDGGPRCPERRATRAVEAAPQRPPSGPTPVARFDPSGAGVFELSVLFDLPLAVRVERIVEWKLEPLVLEVVGGHPPKPRRGRLEPGRLDRRTGAAVGDPDNLGQLEQGRVGEPVLPDEGIKGKELLPVLLVVMEFVFGDVERRGPLSPGHFHHLLPGYVEELGPRIDKPLDEPGAGDSVHVGLFPCDPLHRPSGFEPNAPK